MASTDQREEEALIMAVDRPSEPVQAPWRDDHPIAVLIGTRAAIGVVTLFVVSIVVFLATEVLPGNAAYSVLGHTATPQSLRALEVQLHLNRGLFDQYWLWLSGLFTGKLGNSIANGQAVWGQVAPRLVNSAVLVVGAGVIGTIIGVLLGAIAALRKDGWFDHVTSVMSLAVTSLPEFVVAIVLIILFATVVFHLLPAVAPLAPGTYAWSQPKLLVLPVATLVIVIIPYIQRMMRAAMIEALESDYVEMARLKGVPEWQIVLGTLSRTPLPRRSRSSGSLSSTWRAGSSSSRRCSTFRASGQGLVNAVSDRDIPVIQFIVIVLAAFYVFMNIVTDVIALLVSPRRRIAR